MRCLFTSDLHGNLSRYRTLWRIMAEERPEAVLLGGDLLPHFGLSAQEGLPPGHDFIDDFLAGGFQELRDTMGAAYPAVFLILGNDDARSNELDFQAHPQLWHYAHRRAIQLHDVTVIGYAHTPPSPFQLKDWEKYDVSRFVDPGCVSPEEGRRSVPADMSKIRYDTIAQDLDTLAANLDLPRSIWLFHGPPHDTGLDRAALDGKMIDHVPLDVHVGSIAIKRFIESRQPLITLHGHIHETVRLTGVWHERIGGSHAFAGAHDGPELALVRFDTDAPDAATRELII